MAGKIKDFVGWGFLLWLVGYILGFVFFMFVPKSLLGWAIMPFGIALTLFVLFKKIKSVEQKYYLYLGVTWTVIAVIFDYFFIVKMLNSIDYYKLDVYLYYLLTFLLPVFVGFSKNKSSRD